MSAASPAPSVEVLRGGALTTVQDLGRRGHGAQGVPASGAMDPWAARAANRAVGNSDGSALFEITLAGPTLLFRQPATVALVGDPFDVELIELLGESGERRRLAGFPAEPLSLKGNTGLAIGRGRAGARAWMAIAGGLDVPEVLGSRATDLAGAFGGHEGRALAAGDCLAIAASRDAAARPEPKAPVAQSPPDGRFHRGKGDENFERLGSRDPRSARSFPFDGSFSASGGNGRTAGGAQSEAEGEATLLRVLPGPDRRLLARGLDELLADLVVHVDPRSDRRGVRLAGGQVELAPHAPLRSQPVLPGTVQAPGSGELIVLGPDAPVTGGYPWVAQVIEADLGLLAHLAPGAPVRLELVDFLAAERALGERWRALDAWLPAGGGAGAGG